MLPVATSSGIQLMSVNLLLDNETDPVLWRGPVIGGVVTQFWTDVIWDVDYLFEKDWGWVRSPQLSPQALQSWVHSDMVILLYGFHFPLFLIHYPPKEPVRPWEGECLLFPVGQILPPLGQGLPVAGGAEGREGAEQTALKEILPLVEGVELLLGLVSGRLQAESKLVPQIRQRLQPGLDGLAGLGGPPPGENPVLTFLLGALLTSLVEYVTSYAMEKLFHMRWWDYSRYRFHLNGRVSLLSPAPGAR